MLVDLAEVYRLAGDSESALAYCEQSLTISREIGDRGEGDALRSMGKALYQLHREEEAQACWRDALAVFEELDMPNDAAEIRKLLDSG